ncbi:hypothetical protein CspeluHIS016_0302590 [Cutaneotrichosporon spelunceum]|uniref:Amino acid permease/ SLC12A domain-containing protein n=1 Tax=Cutaneotrichosporon spelunceum TaxID=1672016 RepID=A0AAD3TTR2_9TREE|nr:hypothetical protein CspeluHIS016_0302590 [Cutaneotrichosporon spelunceum]
MSKDIEDQVPASYYDDKNTVTVDVEDAKEVAGDSGEPTLHRGLKDRHIQMIALGGVIGTALFLGTASALADGGPLGMFLGFALMGTVVYSMMACLGEMIVHTPIAGGHIALAQRYVGDSMSFAMGWFYWYLWTILFPAELSACAVLIGYWLPDVNVAVWITVCLVVCTFLNSWSVRVYGESEFWFALTKILLIIGLILASVIVSAGGNPKHEVIGFKFWTGENGPFRQYLDIGGSLGQFLGFWATLTRAAFGYCGLENVSIAAGEAEDPKNNMAKAIKRVWIRIVIFFVCTTFVITLIMPSSDPGLRLSTGTAASSPFVLAFSRVGIKALPSVINAGILCSATSAASAHMYLSTRALWALAHNGRAPGVFKRTNRWGTPIYCVLVTFAFGLLGYTAAGDKTAYQIFDYFSSMIAVVGLISWCGIAVIYIRFHRACRVQGFNRAILKKYKAPDWMQPFLGYYTLIFCGLVVFFNKWRVFLNGHWDVAEFIVGYLPIPLFFLAYFGHKLYKKDKLIPLHLIDLETDSHEEDFGPPKPPPTTRWGRFVAAIV